VLNAAGFQPIPIPDTLDETPEQIHNELES
jgi:hypothetical protein